MGNESIMFALDKAKLAVALANANMTISDLAEALNISRSALSSILAKEYIRPVTAGRIAKALNVKSEELI